MEWAFDYLQRDGEGDPDERTWLRDETGGSVYLRLTTNPIEQPGKRHDDAFRKGPSTAPTGCATRAELRGGDRLPGRVAPEAIAAAGRIAEHRRDMAVLAVTSADRLNAGWTAAQRERARGNAAAHSHIEMLFEPLPSHCSIVTVIDGHPATLAWLGSVQGHRVISHGVEHFGQTGTIGDLYRHFGIDRDALVGSPNPARAGPNLLFFRNGAKTALWFVSPVMRDTPTARRHD
jgi:pyruvate dehydrogenase E1 component